MASYTADAVGLLRYLVNALPLRADEAFTRAEAGVDVIRAPDVQLAEVLYQVTRGGVVAGVELRASPNEALRRLVVDGPVDVAVIDEQVLAVYGSIADQYSMHDGLLVANHRVIGADAVISKDEGLTGVETIWE